MPDQFIVDVGNTTTGTPVIQLLVIYRPKGPFTIPLATGPVTKQHWWQREFYYT